MKYTVQHSYSSARDGQRFGPWQPGEEVDLEQADAEWVNRDSPGCLKETKAPAERQQPKTADRQHRSGVNRSA